MLFGMISQVFSSKNPPPFPKGRYNVILADPPWSYRDKAHAGKRGVEYKYPTMSIDDICALPVQSIAADDCSLFLWATHPNFPYGFQALKSWGFVFKTAAFVWIKLNKKADTLFWGGGHYTRANPETILLGTRGKPKRVSASVHSVVMSKVGKHSAKPPEVRERIVQLMGDVPRIELFARERVDGWDAWGLDV